MIQYLIYKMQMIQLFVNLNLLGFQLFANFCNLKMHINIFLIILMGWSSILRTTIIAIRVIRGVITLIMKRRLIA